MTELFKNKYRIQTTRASWWDYGDDGAYFITICTSKREHYFGKITGGKMQLSDIGKQVRHCWMKIPEHFPFVKLDEFIIMPDHIHGIIIINKSESTDKSLNAINDVDNGDRANGVLADGDHIVDNHDVDNHDVVETQNIASLQTMEIQRDIQSETKLKNNFGPQSNNLASIIRGFKIGVTLYCKQNKILFGWQPRFHDHIIRDYDELNRIRIYIMNNPVNWGDD